MSMDKRFTESYIEELAHKYKTGTLTPAEEADFDAWYRSHDDTVFFHTEGNDPQEIKERLLSNILTKTHAKEKSRMTKLWPRIAAAASIILACSVGGYFILHKPAPQQQFAQNQPQDIAPGHNQATLTLANGQKIILTKGLSGTLAQQGNTAIRVNGFNEVAYSASGAIGEVQYNTLSTAKGEVSPYPLVLADGTKVWLNAESSITFPTAFTDKQRIVKITGEAYFEVAHNAAQPFKVDVKGQMIEDIGTHFNVNSYDDEHAVKTTLLEGSVKILNTILTPGQQAVVTDGDHIKVRTANTSQAVAWRYGRFSFDQTDLRTMMRQVARWYDLSVVYQGEVPNEEFDGEVPQNVNLSQMLKILATSDVHFRINTVGGKKELIITP